MLRLLQLRLQRLGMNLGQLWLPLHLLRLRLMVEILLQLLRMWLSLLNSHLAVVPSRC